MRTGKERQLLLLAQKFISYFPINTQTTLTGLRKEQTGIANKFQQIFMAKFYGKILFAIPPEICYTLYKALFQVRYGLQRHISVQYQFFH